MGELLFQKWMEEEIENIQVALIMDGVNGLLHAFEFWLGRNGYLKEEQFDSPDAG